MVMMSMLSQFKALICRPFVILYDLVTSASYVYPFTGVSYVARHIGLWPFFFAILIPHLITLALFFTLVFILMYPLQTLVFFFIQGPTSVYTSFVLVFQEASAITMLFSDLFLFPTPSAYLFDSILISRGFKDFILQGKLRRRHRLSFKQKVWKFLLYQLPWLIICPWWLFQILLILALNLIPFVGPVLVVFVKAPAVGVRYHARYFDLKFKDRKKTTEFIHNNKGKYYGFGLTAAMLESIPVLEFAFKFTNIVGACLWSCELIKSEMRILHKQNMLINAPDMNKNASHQQDSKMEGLYADSPADHPPDQHLGATQL